MTRPRALLVLFGLVLGLNAYWFLFGTPVVTDHPARTVMGSLLIFLLPGLAWGEVLGLRARSPLETIALAFALTLTLEIGLLLAVLPFGVRIDVWLALLLGASALGLAVLVRRAWRGEPFEFATGLLTLPGGCLSERAVHAACVLVPLLLGGAAYRWGEVVGDLGGEKFVHLMFVRYYADMPLVLRDLAIDRGLTPANLVHLWEFLLAAWARAVRCDPLPLFCHARCVVPVLGLAGMYLLTRMVFVARRKTAAVFAGVLVLCAAQLVLDSTCLAWVRGTDPSRGVFAFLGTAHHGDTAMDLLLALSAGIVLLFLRRPNRASLLLLAGVLAANFLWHPREFLQVAFYLGVLAPTALLLPSLRRLRVWKRGLAATVVLFLVAAAAAALSLALAGRESHGYDEVGLKRTAVRHAFEREHLGTVRNLFNFPLHCFLAAPHAPAQVETSAATSTRLAAEWQYDTWLFLAAGGMVLLGVLGNWRDRQLAFYQFLLWLVAYAWNAGVLLVLALTYSEFLFTTPRLLYLVAYLVIADAFVVLGTAVHALARRARAPLAAAAALAVALSAGISLWAWQRAERPGQETAAVVLSAASFGLFLLVLRDRPFWSARRRPVPLALMVVLMLAGLLPLCQWDVRAVGARAVRPAPAEIDWFGPDNPFGYSPEFIGWLRALPPGHKLLSNPLHQDLPCVYSAQYLAVHATASIIKDIADRADVQAGRHPFFGPYRPASAIEHARAVAWLRGRRVDYVVVARQDYAMGLDRYFRAHAAEYELAFENAGGKEAVFQVRD